MSTSNDDGHVYIFRRFIRRKDGTVIDAHTYGLKAFRIRVTNKRRT